METLKTVALIMLLMSSLGLTGRIWFDNPQVPPEPKGFAAGDVVTGTTGLAGIKTAFMPEKIVAHAGGDKHRIFYPGSAEYEAVWAQGDSIGKVLSLASAPVGEVSLQEARSAAGFEMIFPVGLSFRVLKSIWAPEAKIEPAASDFYLDRIIVETGERPSLVLPKDINSGFIIPVTGVHGLPEPAGMGDEEDDCIMVPFSSSGFTFKPGIYVPRRPSNLPDMVVQADQKPSHQDILRAVSMDPAMARAITEKDEAVVYVDGSKGVRVYGDGSYEYIWPQASNGENSLDDMHAIAGGIGYMMTHGGLPDGVHPEYVIPSKDENQRGVYRVGFSYRINGLPVVGTRPPVEISLSEKGVFRYFRSVKAVSPQPSAIGPLTMAEALQAVAAAQLTRPDLTDLPEISDVYMAYHNPNPSDKAQEMRLVWAMDLPFGRKIIVNARTGEVY